MDRCKIIFATVAVAVMLGDAAEKQLSQPYPGKGQSVAIALGAIGDTLQFPFDGTAHRKMLCPEIGARG